MIPISGGSSVFSSRRNPRGRYTAYSTVSFNSNHRSKNKGLCQRRAQTNEDLPLPTVAKNSANKTGTAAQAVAEAAAQEAVAAESVLSSDSMLESDRKCTETAESCAEVEKCPQAKQKKTVVITTAQKGGGKETGTKKLASTARTKGVRL